jgi:hypothetical protein
MTITGVLRSCYFVSILESPVFLYRLTPAVGHPSPRAERIAIPQCGIFGGGEARKLSKLSINIFQKADMAILG